MYMLAYVISTLYRIFLLFEFKKEKNYAGVVLTISELKTFKYSHVFTRFIGEHKASIPFRVSLAL